MTAVSGTTDRAPPVTGETLASSDLEQTTAPCRTFNPLNAELNPIRHLLALVEARHIVHVGRVRVSLEL